MKLGLINSAWAQAGRGTEFGIEQTKRIGFDPSVQRFHLDRVKKYLDVCKEFTADNLLLVLGEYIWERQVIPPAEQWKTGVENVRKAGEYARQLGLEIALELEPFKLSLV